MKPALMQTIVVSALTMTLCGCGGSGNGVAPIGAPPPAPAPAPPPAPTPVPAPAPAPPPSSGFNTQEYQNSRGAVQANAIRAYESGATGAGVTVAVIDTSFVPLDAPQFAGRIHPASTDVVAGRALYGGAGQVADGHGAEVASIVGAARDGSGMQGVAFDSRLLMIRTDLPNTCNPRCGLSLSDLDNALDVAIQNGARVINLSLTLSALPPGFTEAVDRATAAGIVVVIAAGNQGQTEAMQSSLLALRPEARATMIVAGATDNSGGALASYSNRAGGSASFYLAAVGTDVQVTNQDGAVVIRSGTSLSTPVISGAAALLAQAFPNLTGRQIVELLLTTATDMGAAGTDAVYGRGALNLTAAFAPQGTMSLAGSSAPIASLQDGMLSPAMGDASAMLGGAVFLDRYARAYRVGLTRALATAAPDLPLHAALTGRAVTNAAALGALAVSVVTKPDGSGQSPMGVGPLELSALDAGEARALAARAMARLSPSTTVAFGYGEGGRTLQRGLANQESIAFLVARDPLADSGLRANGSVSAGLRHDLGPFALSVISEHGHVIDPVRIRDARTAAYRITSLVADRALGPFRISLGGSYLEEAETMLGGRPSTALSAGARTWFADGVASLDLASGWSARASYRHGWTTMDGISALVTGGHLASNAFALDIAKAGVLARRDRLAVRVMQPLRVMKGGLGFQLPISYDYASGPIRYQHRFLDLAPTGREVVHEVSYGAPLWSGDIAVHGFFRTDPGNIGWMRDDIGGAVRFTLGF